ncbi:MAG: glycosyltransferase [Eubacteriales bacterium]|nr:glycosyltransferase [Eubacteriales bacterium]
MERPKKKVLIVSYYFAPQNTIGAVRPTKLAKYFERMGIDVTVLCGSGMDDRVDPTLERDLRELRDVHVIREWNPLKTLKARKAKGGQQAVTPGGAAQASEPEEKKSAIHRLMNSAYLLLWVLADCSFERKAKKELRKLQGGYDAVFSSYAPMSAHEIAALAKKRGLAKRWAADFRDEMGVSFRWQNGRMKRLRKCVERDADVLTAVSKGTLEAMGMPERAKVLLNGFDREDAPELPAVERKDDFFRAAYCGQFHMGRKGVGDRDITPVMAALAKLTEKGILPKERLRLCYAGTQEEVFVRYAKQCGLEECVELHGSVSREESLKIQAQADLLMMASWNTAAQTGILTGKLFEYLMMGKPIVCYMSGEAANSEMKALLEKTGAGFCGEQAAGQADRLRMEDYVERLATRWLRGENPLPDRSAENVEACAYDHLSKELAHWLELI